MLESGDLQRFFCLMGSEGRLSEELFLRVYFIFALGLLRGHHVMEHPRTSTAERRRVERLILRGLQLLWVLTWVLGWLVRVAELLLFHAFLVVELFLFDAQVLVV